MSPGTFDRDSLEQHLRLIDETLTQLAPHKGRPVDLLRSSVDERWAVERGLQLCVQNVLDVATHLVASAGRDVRDYTTAIEQLGQLSIITPALAATLRPLAGFRNALVHGYMALDLAIVHSVLNHALDQVREFVVQVKGYIDATAGA